MQSLAAVVILGALLGGFYALFAMRHGLGSQGGQPGSFTVSTPVTDASQVIVTGTRDGSVVALRPSDGQIYWRYNFSGRYPITSIFIQQGVVYIVSAFGADNTVELFALRLRDGHALWHEQLGYDAGYPNFFQVDNGILYMEIGLDAPGVSEQGSGVVAVRLNDGTQLWHTPYSHLISVADGIVYLGSLYTDAAGALPMYAVEGTTGKRLWTFLSPSGNGVLVAAIYQGRVYLYDSSLAAPAGELVAVDEQTGIVLRHLSIPPIGGNFFGNFAQGTNGVLYEFGSTHLYAITLTSGNRLWTAPLTGAETAAQSIAVTDSAIYLLSFPNNSHLVVTALSVASGKLLWNTDTGPVGQYSVYNSGGVSIGGGFYEAQGIIQIGEQVFIAGTPGLITLRASDGHVLRRDLPHDILFVVAQPTP